MVFTLFKKKRILYLYSLGHAPTISMILEKEGMKASKKGVYRFLKYYRATVTIGRQTGSGRLSKVTTEVKWTVEEQMRADNKTTSYCTSYTRTARNQRLWVHCFKTSEPKMASLVSLYVCEDEALSKMISRYVNNALNTALQFGIKSMCKKTTRSVATNTVCSLLQWCSHTTVRAPSCQVLASTPLSHSPYWTKFIITSLKMKTLVLQPGAVIHVHTCTMYVVIDNIHVHVHNCT